MPRSLPLLLLLLLAAPAGAQAYDAFAISQGAFGAQNSSVVQLRGSATGTPSASPIAQGRIYTQGAEVIGQRLYLTAGDAFSGTSRVDVLDAATGALVGQITENVLNPRYLVDVSFAKAYVTNQDYSGGASFVTPIDLQTTTAGTPIPVEGMPEDLTVVFRVGSPTVAVVALGAFGGKDSLAVINTETDALLGYVDIGCAARFVVGVDEAAWAVCPDTDEAVEVDPYARRVMGRIAFGFEIGDPYGIGQDAAPFAGIPTGGRRSHNGIGVVIASERGVIRLDSFVDDYEVIPIADVATRPITAIAAGRGGGPILLGRADPDNPFGANGTVTYHAGDGTLVETFAAGVFPSFLATPEGGFGAVAAAGAPAAGGLGLAFAGPNPVRGRTAVAITLDRPGSVRVEVLDVLGRVVATLADGALAGTVRLGVDAGRLAPGTYLVRATADGATATLPLTVAR